MNLVRRLRGLTLIVGLMGLSSCATVPGGVGASGSEETKDVLPKASAPAVAFFTDRCPVSERDPRLESFGLVGPAVAGAVTTLFNTVLPPLTEVVVTRVADWLDARAMALNASTSASVDGALYQRTQIGNFVHRHGCLVFVRGGFGTSDPELSEVWTASRLNRLNGALSASGKTLRVASRPEVYAEFSLVYTSSRIEPIGQAAAAAAGERLLYNDVGLQPVFLDYSKVGAERVGDGRKTLLFSINFTSRSMRLSDSESSVFLSDVIDLGRLKGVEDGTTLTAMDLEHKTATRFRLPQPAVVTIKDEAGKDVGRTDDVVPFTATVALTETDKGGDFERAAAEALQTKKADLAKAATDPLGQAFRKWIEETLDVETEGSSGT